MTICYISLEYPPETGWGGIGTYVYNMSKLFGNMGGDKVIVITASDDGTDKVQKKGNILIHRVSMGKDKGIWHGVWKTISRILPVYHVRFAYQANKILRKIQQQHTIDIIEATDFGASAFFVLKNRPCPVIIRLHSPLKFILELNGEIKNRARVSFFNKGFDLMDQMEKVSLRRADLVVSPSVELAKALGYRWGFDPKEVTIEPYPVLSFSQPSKQKEKNIFFAGRFERRKGFHTLLKAFKKIADQIPHSLVIAGADNGSLKLLEYEDYKGIKDKIKVLPFLDKDELNSYYKQAEIVCFPSEWFDNYPYTVLEALSVGATIIASDCGGIPEIITHNSNGLLFPYGNHEALAEQILTLIHSKERRRKLGQGAYESSRTQYDPRKSYQRMLNIYQNVIHENSSSC